MKNILKKAQTNILVVAGVLALAAILIPTSVYAARTIDSATVNGGSTTTVAPSGTVNVSLTVTTTGNSSSNDWESTRYQIEGKSSHCVNTDNHTTSGTYSESFTITAPSDTDTYNLTLRAYENGNCSGGYGEKVLNNAITTAIIYSVESYGENTYTTVKNDFYPGETVFGKATRNVDANLRLRYRNSSNNVVHSCNYSNATSVTCDYVLPVDAPTGEWDIQIGRCDDQCWKQNKWTWTGYGEDHFNVLTPPPATIIASKVICDREADLPNWGDHGATVGANTAAEYVAASEGKCHLTEWNFQWAYDYVGNPGDNSGEQSGPWQTFTDTVQINDLSNDKIWLREVWNDQYVPFSGDYTKPFDTVSAEFYCNGDTLNYDNYEWINNLNHGQTYYCVAFNAYNEPDYSISGFKYNDYNGNGSWTYNMDPILSEPMLDGWTIFIDENDNSVLDSGEVTTVSALNSNTNTHGQFFFTGLSAGTYRICEDHDQQPGWQQTQPVDGNGDPVCESIELTRDNPTNSVIFGNQLIPTYDLHGYKWNDLDGDGYRDCEFVDTTMNIDSGIQSPPNCEPYLSGWTIHLKKDNEIIKTDVTSDDINGFYGSYYFDGLLAGTYEVCEILQPGWSQTFPESPICHTITLPSNQAGDTCTTGIAVIGPNSALEQERLPMCNFGNQEIPIELVLGCFPNFVETNKPNFVDLSDFSFFGQCQTSDVNYKAICDVNSDGLVNEYDKSVFEVYYNKPFICGSSVCGNNVLQSGETCDDGNITNGDGCSATCTIEEPLKEETATPSITLTKSDTPDPVKAGENITYTLTYTVAGTLVNDLKLVDTLPANTTFVSATNSGIYDNASKTVTWNLGTVLVGSYSVGLVVKVDGVLANGTVLTNTAALSGTGVETKTAIQATTVNSSATLSVVKSVEKSPVYPGDAVNYIVTIKNNGSDTAINLRLADTMPAGFTYDDGLAGSWLFGNLAVGEEKNFIYSVTVGTSVVPGTYTNTAQVSADNVASITATANLAVIAKPGVVLGAETEGKVLGAEDEALPKAGSPVTDYLFSFVILLAMAFGVSKVKV